MTFLHQRKYWLDILSLFDIANFSPSLKLKRPPTVKKYRHVLDELYAQALEEQSAPKAKL